MKETEKKDIGDDGRKSTQFRLASVHDTTLVHCDVQNTRSRKKWAGCRFAGLSKL